MKKILLASLVVVGLLVSSSAVVQACPGKKAECSKCEEKAKQCKITKLKNQVKPLWEHKDVLKINETQMSQIKAIKHAAIKKLIQFNADKDIVMVDLKSAMKADQFDVNAINALIDAKYSAKNKTAKTYIKAIGDIQAILTKEQRAQWNEMSKKAESKCSKCSKGKKCKKCSGAEGEFCPLTGKSLKEKGSHKGSHKGSMK